MWEDTQKAESLEGFRILQRAEETGQEAVVLRLTSSGDVCLYFSIPISPSFVLRSVFWRIITLSEGSLSESSLPGSIFCFSPPSLSFFCRMQKSFSPRLKLR
ncbi:hypothetical protein CesoFtcFv8_026236 [Champsocephalus esox]|uniref:Uncharacterized protein n=1 Tax=Champsocephalus esox TaxID=159716 RepID=A0AAN8GCW7_9TELE|nr:hypothetical protein CesoFtcFv8_026236 [Champsocephalus esox]